MFFGGHSVYAVNTFSDLAHIIFCLIYSEQSRFVYFLV